MSSLYLFYNLFLSKSLPYLTLSTCSASLRHYHLFDGAKLRLFAHTNKVFTVFLSFCNTNIDIHQRFLCPHTTMTRQVRAAVHVRSCIRQCRPQLRHNTKTPWTAALRGAHHPRRHAVCKRISTLNAVSLSVPHVLVAVVLRLP